MRNVWLIFFFFSMYITLHFFILRSSLISELILKTIWRDDLWLKNEFLINLSAFLSVCFADCYLCLVFDTIK